MTKIFKRMLTWMLGAIACVAIVCGVLVARPQVMKANASETTVTFSSAVREGIEKDPYGVSVRFDTQGEQWTTSFNWVDAAAWKTISDYTTVNGRTVTEINNATTNDQKITLMLQKADGFSFLRLYIPKGVMPLDDVKSMGILDGWSFDDGTTKYTTSAVTFLHAGGSAMTKSDAYSSKPTLTAENITIGDANLTNPSDSRYGVDSYNVSIDIGQQIASEYDTMYDGYASIRKAIYINGKSIEEWNTQLIAKDARFGEPSSYTRFPQNSTDPSHLSTFVKPIGFWGTSTGFRLTIYQELAAMWENIVITVGAGCTYNNVFMVAETVTKTVLTQNVVDITNDLTFMDNSHNAPAAWGGTTSLYYIHTNNKAYWKGAPMGGALNECDPSGAGGGQIQMKYLYFNGECVWDINKNDNGAYGSIQDNIVAPSGVYAPIFVTMSGEVGSSLKFTVPNAYPSGSGTGKENHKEIIIKRGFNVAVNGTSYVVTSDIIFTNTNGVWSKTIKTTEVETEVTGIITYANRTDGGNNENFVLLQLSNNDYAGVNQKAVLDFSSLLGYIDIGGNIVNATPGEPFFNVWGVQNSIAFRAPNLTAADLSKVSYITIKAGAKFPSYNTQYNGGALTYFVTTEDVTFVHNRPQDVWTVGAVPTECTVTYTVDGGVYTTQTVMAGMVISAPDAPTKAEDDNFTYTFDGWYLNNAKYDFTQPITGNITLTAKFTATPKTSEVDITSELAFVHQAQQNAGTETYMIKTTSNCWTKAPQGGCLNECDQVQMKYIYLNGKSLYDINKEDDGSYGSSQGNIASGGVYAPILVLMGLEQNSKYSYIQLHVPSAYPNADFGANENHDSIEIKAGFSVTENNVTYMVSKDLKWVNLNGTWVPADNLLAADTMSIAEAVIDGVELELAMVSITNPNWNLTNDPFDYNYYGAENLVAMRKNIFINGKSLFEINTTVNDSGYNYVTEPQNNGATGTYNGATYELFANPTLLYGKGQELKVYIHREYLKTLGAGEITLTVGKGFVAYAGKALAEDVSKVVTMNYSVLIDSSTQIVMKNGLAVEPSAPVKEMTPTESYVFEAWYHVGTDTKFTFDTPITSNIELEARFKSLPLDFRTTSVTNIVHYEKKSTETWMLFELSNEDYQEVQQYVCGYEELLRIGTLNAIVLKGEIRLNDGRVVSQATLLEVYNNYGRYEGPYFNIWDSRSTLSLRVPVGSGITEIVVEAGCHFPSYKQVIGQTDKDTRYVVEETITYKYDESIGEMGTFIPQAELSLNMSMENGASVRVSSDKTTSGIRFTIKINKDDVDILEMALMEGTYAKVEYGALIVPTDYLMGGKFTHDWLTKNYGADGFLDILSSVTYLDAEKTEYTADGWEWPKVDENYVYYYASIVNLKDTNYNRYFSSVGYVKLTYANGEVEYIYTQYNSANSRSAAFVANAAINDRSENKTDDYTHRVEEDGKYSPYSPSEHTLLKGYLAGQLTSQVQSQALTSVGTKGGEQTITVNQALNGAYVKLVYTTDVNVWGVFKYRNADSSITAKEDFYLQAGTTEHKQLLDIFRFNGVGYGLSQNDIYLESITFKNAELKSCSGSVTLHSFTSQVKDFDTSKMEIYLTREQDDGSEMTIGAHLGLGGSFTYLAKSGIYEGVVEQSENTWVNQNFWGYTKYKANTGRVVLSDNSSIYDENHATGDKTSEAGYYGNATSSRSEDGAVNLINNVDAGRQIQQSWYAQVGGNSEATNGENGYTRADCTTGATLQDPSQYWPYNPVQAGDVVSNPGQIIDFEINETKGYIYVKTRAMDWAKGYNKEDPREGTVEGGVTTKSYMENYYRLGTDGTVTVNNRFVDWNGFEDMESCAWASNELPAVYPVHTLNYYVTNIDGDGSWKDNIEFKSDLESWVENAYIQNNTGFREVEGVRVDTPTKVEDWFAWANGGTMDSFGVGVYIPNTAQWTSGRSNTSTGLDIDINRNALNNVLPNKGEIFSNMQPIELTYKSTYVNNTSYTAPVVSFRMEEYVPIEYSYVICVDSITNIRETFKQIKDNGTVTNAGDGYQKIGLDTWARADKKWTW